MITISSQSISTIPVHSGPLRDKNVAFDPRRCDLPREFLADSRRGACDERSTALVISSRWNSRSCPPTFGPGLASCAGHGLRKTGGASAQVFSGGYSVFPNQHSVHRGIPQRHGQHDESARNHRRTGRRYIKIAATRANQETQDETNRNLHAFFRSESRCRRVSAQTPVGSKNETVRGQSKISGRQ